MIAGHGEKRTRREEAAIAALLTEPTITLAAAKAGIGETTLLRWLREPSFSAQYRAARRMVVEEAVGRLQQAASGAVDALVRNLSCGVPASEIAAAKAIVDQAFRGAEVLDLAERVAQLEQAAAVKNGERR